MLTTPKRIRKLAIGDPDTLCENGNKNKNRYSMLNKYESAIIELLSQNNSYIDIYRKLSEQGHSGSYNNIRAYCKKLELRGYDQKLSIKSTNPLPRYISRQDFFKHIWSGKKVNYKDKEYVYSKYPLLEEIEECVIKFRKIYTEKSLSLLQSFITQYSQSTISKLKSFATGLKQDIAAVENSVTSPYSNGILEGNNNRLKMIKRMMYGRAKLPLLKAKILIR